MLKSQYLKNKEKKELQIWEQYRDLSEEELIVLLDDSDTMKSLQAAKSLQLKGGCKVIKLAQRDCFSLKYGRRALGAFILGQIKLSFFVEKKSTNILNQLALCDKSAIVRSNAVSSLGHRCKKNNKNAKSLLKLCQHTAFDSSVYVRESTSFALSNFYDDASIPLLIKLLNDPHYRVRDWAAFAVNVNGYNTPELRDCFACLLNDNNPNVRYEVIIGLAKMQDKRVTKILIDELSKDEVYDELVEAAGYLGDVALLPALRKIKSKFDPFDALSLSISILEKI